MTSPGHQLNLSDDVEAAEWIRSRLRPPEQHIVASIMPTGFDAYARIFHPAHVPDHRAGLVRWFEVSRWSGVVMDSHVQWLKIALPQIPPTSPPPWRGQGPRAGSPFKSDVEALIEILADSTSTPKSCYFCVWTGHLGGGARYGSSGTSEILPPAPRPSRLVQFPWREYALYEGPLTCAASFEQISDWHELSPNLWWPSDRSWCVATPIDLPYSVVGGSTELIEHVLANETLEALSVEGDEPIAQGIDEWLAQLIEQATDEVLANGGANLSLALGTVRVTLEKSGLLGHRSIHSTTAGANGTSSGGSPVRTRDPQHLRRQVHNEVRRAVVSLVSV